MKRIIFYVLLTFLFVNVSAAQSVDERIGNAMNSESWHQLRKIYMEEGTHIQSPFLKTLSRFFVAHFYNEPDSALHYGGILLEKYQGDLGGGVANVLYLMSDDAARLGLWNDAYQMMHAYNAALAQAQVPANRCLWLRRTNMRLCVMPAAFRSSNRQRRFASHLVIFPENARIRD